MNATHQIQTAAKGVTLKIYNAPLLAGRDVSDIDLVDTITRPGKAACTAVARQHYNSCIYIWKWA